MNPWICPKCDRVWGPLVMECVKCNNPPITTTTTNPFPNHVTPYITQPRIGWRYGPMTRDGNICGG